MATIQELGIAQVNNTNLFSQVHANIFNLIDNKVNIPDPISTLPPQQQSRKMVYTRLPDVASINFKGYPFIVVESPINNPQFYTLDNSKSFNSWEIKIDVYSSDRLKDSNEARGLEFLNTLCNDIMKTLNNKTNRKTLRNFGMSNINPASNKNDVIFTEGELIYNKTFEIPFMGMINTGG